MNNTQTPAYFGLGSMGYGMVSNMTKAGIVMRGYDFDLAWVVRFLGDGDQPGTFNDATTKLESVVVVNTAQVEALLFGDDGEAAKLKPGTSVIDCATTLPAFVRKLAARCAAAGLAYLDAPISGEADKDSGELSVMDSGHQDTYAKTRPMLDALSAKAFEMGDEPGAGTTMKIVHQLLAGTHVVTMLAAMVRGVSQDFTPAQLTAAIPHCLLRGRRGPAAGPPHVDRTRGFSRPCYAQTPPVQRCALGYWLDVSVLEYKFSKPIFPKCLVDTCALTPMMYNQHVMSRLISPAKQAIAHVTVRAGDLLVVRSGLS